MEEKGALQLPDEAEYPKELTEGFELLECMYASAEAETLLARDRKTGEKVTVKCYKAEHPLFGHAEPEALRHLKAPPLPEFVGEYQSGHMRCVVRRYVEGESLAERAARAPMTEEEITLIGLALCGQLETLHGARPPVIHRDVKPQNIILKEDGSPVLIDFGISRQYTEKDTDTLIMGTQGFAPPEQYGFAQTDARSDIYALGMVLKGLLANGKNPHNVSAPLERVLRKMTAFDPRQRFQTARQAGKALKRTRPEARRRKIAGWALGAAALLVCLWLAIGAGVPMHDRRAVFSDPLTERAVRASLGMGEGEFLSEDMLEGVKGIYLVADTPCADMDSFFAAVNGWYAAGRPVRGTLRDLEDLRRMPNLEKVCMAAQEIQDISALAELKKLTMAELKHNDIRDISVLAGREKLTWVGLNDNPVRDLSPLAECLALSCLDLCDVRNYDPRILEELGNFDYLDLSNPTESWRCLGRRGVNTLVLAWTGLNSLEDLSGITRLESLDISHTAVTDLSPITAHQGLRRLKMTQVPAADLRPLMELPLLEMVILSPDMKEPAAELEGCRFAIVYE